MTPQTMGIIGGIAGCVRGCLGGALGTYCSIRAAKNAAAKTFVKKASAVNWLVAIIFLAILIFTPRPWNFMIWVPYGLLMSFGIRYMNKRIFELEKDG